MSEGSPAAELVLDPVLVLRVLERQAPVWSGYAIRPFEAGWDNVMFRLGDQHLVRMPRRQSADAPIRHEQRALPFLQPRLSPSVPTPVFNGKPSADFPWHWSVVPFFTATTASRDPLSQHGAVQWAEFMASLHREYVPGIDPVAPENPYRGVDINTRRMSLNARLSQLEALGEPVPAALLDTWLLALAQPRSTLRVWIHGDPHGRNVLCESGTLKAVIDWGDVTTGDPASDLASFWMLIRDPVVRSEAIRHYLAVATYSLSTAESSALMLRARGWAFLYAAMLLGSGLIDHPENAAMGRATFQNLLA